MILEHVPLQIDPERTADFEAAYATAIPLVTTTDGCHGATLRRCVEEPSRYLLLIEWRTLEDHTIGFRESDRFQRWRELVGPFFAEAPNVHHYEELGGAAEQMPTGEEPT